MKCVNVGQFSPDCFDRFAAVFFLDTSQLVTMDNVDVADLVERLGSDEDAARKMAVFKLQSSIGDPSFADLFITEGGLTRLRYLTLHASGNTLAYSLTSFARLLEVDKGWESIDQELVERVGFAVIGKLHSLTLILIGPHLRSSNWSSRIRSSIFSAAPCRFSSPWCPTPTRAAARRSRTCLASAH